MRIRTADILLAKQTLYQLSYTPFQSGRIVFYEWRRKRNELCAALLERADFLVVLGAALAGLQPRMSRLIGARPTAGTPRERTCAIYSIERR